MRGYRLAECEKYLAIWTSAKEKIEKASKKAKTKPFVELLSEEEIQEINDALESGDDDDALADFEDK